MAKGDQRGEWEPPEESASESGVEDELPFRGGPDEGVLRGVVLWITVCVGIGVFIGLYVSTDLLGGIEDWLDSSESEMSGAQRAVEPVDARADTGTVSDVGTEVESGEE